MHNKPHAKCIAREASRPVRHNGLTLIELLVAISILSFIAVLGWRGLDSIIRARIALTGDLEQTRGMQLTFAQLQSDCAHLTSITALPDRMPLVVEQGRLTLIRTVYADNQPSRLQVVTYRVKDGVLTRRESVATRDFKELGMLWRTAANDSDTSRAVALQAGVTALTMRLWISGGTSWRTSAEVFQLPTTPASTANPPPGQASVPPPLLTGLEVAVQLQGHQDSLLKTFLLGAV
ncbi:MAG: prepilin-type N-terminal cleavage/methylation domain-containing protein [Nitrosomonadales bacterium]|nr:prepilin-type N-terminal cleavage/methylation domain-containing protein [Nitrosomonadales bacterium]